VAALPAPPPGEHIPGSYVWWLASTPDSSIYSNWRPRGDGEVVFQRPHHGRRFAQLSTEQNELLALPYRDGFTRVATVLNDLTIMIPSMLAWVFVGFVGLFFRRRCRLRLLLFVLGVGVVVVVGTALGEPATLEYRMPVDPLFILFGIAGLAGAQRALDSEHHAA